MKILGVLVLACAAFSASANEQKRNSELSDASRLVADGSGLVVYGSLSGLAASGTAVVTSVETVGDATLLVLNGASEAGSASVRLSGEAARGASVVAGASVGVVAISTGHLLVAAGKVLAFIPNQAGKALLHHSRHGAVRE